MTQKLRRMQKSLHTKKVGWCGLGAMGSVMAPHLLAVTDNLIGYDVNPHVWQTALLNLGLKRAEQLTDLAQTDTLITMLPKITSVCFASAVGAMFLILLIRSFVLKIIFIYILYVIFMISNLLF